MNVKKLVSILSKLINCPACSAVYCTLHLAHIICKCDTLHLFHFLFSPVLEERDYHFFLFFSCTTYWRRIPLFYVLLSLLYTVTKKQIIMHKCVCFRIKCFVKRCVVVRIYFADLLAFTGFV